MKMEKTNDDFISLHELNKITKHCLNIMSLMDRLAGVVTRDDEESGGPENNIQYADRLSHELLNSLRKVKIATLMCERSLICVSGMQGAGKTTLMKYFYGLDNEYLNISLDRGEQIPIFITESGQLAQGEKPELYAIRIVKDADGEYRQEEDKMTPEEFREASKGTETTTFYLELRVPHRYMNSEKTSFVLLPGFEAQKSYRETLVDFAVSSSDAAIFAFDGRLLSQQDNYKHLKELAEKFGANIIYAITRSDSSADANAAVRETFVQEMGIQNDDQVVCTGTYADPAKNEEWIEQLRKAVATYTSSTIRSQRNNLEYLRDEIDRIRSRLAEIGNILEEADEGDGVNHENDKLLRAFDKEVKKQAARYEENLRKTYGEGLDRSKQELSDALDRQNRDFANRIRKTILGINKKDLEDAESIVNGSLYQQGDGRAFIPDQCRMKALGAALHTLEKPEKPEDVELPYLLAKEKTQDGKKRLKPGKQNQLVMNTISSMIKQPDTENEPIEVAKNISTQRVMNAIVQIATYYYSVSNYDALASASGSVDYRPSNGTISLNTIGQGTAYTAADVRNVDQQNGEVYDEQTSAEDEMGSGAPETEKWSDRMKETSSVQKLSVGIAAMTGMDLLGDTQINMIPQIAASFGVSVGFVAAVASGALAASAAVAVARDIAKVECQDYNRANMALEDVYANLQDVALQDYMDKMQMLRERLERNLYDLDPRSRRTQQIYFAKRQIYAAENLLDELADRCSERREEDFL